LNDTCVDLSALAEWNISIDVFDKNEFPGSLRADKLIGSSRFDVRQHCLTNLGALLKLKFKLLKKKEITGNLEITAKLIQLAKANPAQLVTKVNVNAVQISSEPLQIG